MEAGNTLFGECISTNRKHTNAHRVISLEVQGIFDTVDRDSVSGWKRVESLVEAPSGSRRIPHGADKYTDPRVAVASGRLTS